MYGNGKVNGLGSLGSRIATTMAAVLLGAGVLLASRPVSAQVALPARVLPNGALDTKQTHWGYDFYRNYSGYDFYFGSADQGTYEDGELHPWNVQGNVWLISGQPGQSNVVVQTGNDGVLVVDTGTKEMAPKLLALIKRLAAQYAGDYKDIRFVVNTDGEMDHIGGNEVIRKGGKAITGIALGNSSPPGATLLSSQNTVLNMVAAGVPEGLWPSEAHNESVYSWYFNDEAVTLHQPASANTNGNLMVMFRRADVLVLGDVMNSNAYPFIDTKHGGTIDGILAALNQAIDLTVAGHHNGPEEGGTMIIPGHGRMVDRAELLYYTIMVTELRNRIMYYKNRGKTLDQVLAMKPTWDFDGRYGATVNKRTPQDFVKAVYETLPAKGTAPDRFSMSDPGGR